MPNDFTKDLQCIALYDPETWGDLGQDMLAANHFAMTPTSDAADSKEGNASLAFAGTSSGVSYSRAYRPGADLSAGMPGLPANEERNLSVVYWVKFDALNICTILGRTLGGRSWTSALQQFYPTKKRFSLGIGYGGSSEESLMGPDITPSLNTWYHVGMSYKGSDKTYRIRIWDGASNSLFGEATGTGAQTMYLGTASLELGTAVDGKIDDLALFNDVLTPDEIDSCRAGTYDYGDDANCIDHWSLDDGDYRTADVGTDDWTRVQSCFLDTTYHKTGSAAMLLTSQSDKRITLADASAGADFPLKVGGGTKISVCYWVRPSYMSGGALRVFAKDNTAKQTIVMGFTTKPILWIGYNSGNSWEQKTAANPTLVVGQWYHIAYTYDDADKSYRIRCWDETAGTVYETTGTMTNSINIEDAPYSLLTGDSLAYAAGTFDELVIFNDVLTAAEIDKIRNGTYGAAEPPAEEVAPLLGFHF